MAFHEDILKQHPENPPHTSVQIVCCLWQPPINKTLVYSYLILGNIRMGPISSETNSRGDIRRDLTELRNECRRDKAASCCFVCLALI